MPVSGTILYYVIGGASELYTMPEPLVHDNTSVYLLPNILTLK